MIVFISIVGLISLMLGANHAPAPLPTGSLAINPDIAIDVLLAFLAVWTGAMIEAMGVGHSILSTYHIGPLHIPDQATWERTIRRAGWRGVISALLSAAVLGALVLGLKGWLCYAPAYGRGGLLIGAAVYTLPTLVLGKFIRHTSMELKRFQLEEELRTQQRRAAQQPPI